MEKIKVGGLMQSDGRALLRILSAPAAGRAAASLIGGLGRAGVNIELLVLSHDRDQRANFALLVANGDLDQALALLEGAREKAGAQAVTFHPDVAAISVFGPHLREKPMVPGLMMGALAGAGIDSLAIATSISSVSVVVEGPCLDPAVAALLEVFEAPFQVKNRPKNY